MKMKWGKFWERMEKKGWVKREGVCMAMAKAIISGLALEVEATRMWDAY